MFRLERVVKLLQDMPAREAQRWQQFLSWILALVYHARSAEEKPELHELVDRSVQAHPHRKEYTKMGRTIAEMYIDQGKQQGELTALRATLLRQLRKRFKKVPRKAETRIAATTSMEELGTWLDNFANAERFAEVGIPLD